MELPLVIIVVSLVLYVAYLEFRISLTQRQTIVVVPSTTEQESGAGCATIALLVMLVVIALAMLKVLPAIG